MDKPKQPWLISSWSDGIFILSPPFISLLIVFLFPAQFQQASGMPLAYWVLLVVFIDVAHVYSTLYRTYFNPTNLKRKGALLLSIPLCCYLIGVLVYHFDVLWFWRILAYLAVFHFIRQQYGFMNLYSRNDRYPKTFRYIDLITIYAATIYPILFWHLSTTRNFNWFIEGDFLTFRNESLLQNAWIIYLSILACFLIKEAYLFINQRKLNIPKNLLIVGTSLSWYFGIVYFNGDMAFTTLNVISHGIPYIALIWFFEKRKINDIHTIKSRLIRLSFGKFGIAYFILIIIAFAYLEEGLWDGLIWKEHQSFFAPFAALPQLADQQLISLLVPLLAVPQTTHYVLDGFIWKRKHGF